MPAILLNMLKSMKLNISAVLLLIVGHAPSDLIASEGAREQLIRDVIIENGFTPHENLYIDKDSELSPEGKVFFESTHMSLNGNIACATCHVSKIGSSDGIPNAVGVRGHGESIERLMSGGKIVPRNSLALWGVGSKGFQTLFWDGKLSFVDGKTISQFGSTAPSDDPLVTAVHLPPVEIRETLEEDAFVLNNKNETVAGVDVIYGAIVDNLRVHEPDAFEALAVKRKIPQEDVRFLDVAFALAAFIRDEFRIKETRIEKFVSGSDSFSDTELFGAEVFYGKGGCVICHSGPNFTDQQFYTVPFPQLGFGKNGFGIDYGRYNATFNPSDLYKFRTPSLFNVANTRPFGHSGSVYTLEEAVTAHYDPLALASIEQYDSLQRHELSKVLALNDTVGTVNFLTEDEVAAVTEFLKTLSF
jgi:cytochrome c peroxidase